MFERLTAESVNPLAIPVEIRMTDGGIAKGKVVASGVNRSLADVLNGPGNFVEFEPYGGEPAFLAKTRIAEVRPLGVPKGINLKARLAASEPLNPHAVLGVPANAGYEQIRKAYVALAKAYHPDRYATAELPPEVLEYLFTMVRRINAAHAALENVRKAQVSAQSAARADFSEKAQQAH
ncbi:MAG: J domain-containing protein [Hyphomicrobiales bacterium]|nr:MAG: J domain-containing protein [Hyphomicrobiales bacterium]